jgi:hypothetical protein
VAHKHDSALRPQITSRALLRLSHAWVVRITGEMLLLHGRSGQTAANTGMLAHARVPEVIMVLYGCCKGPCCACG